MSARSSAPPPIALDPSDADALFEMSLDNVCVAGLDGYFRRVNPAWTQTLGWSAAELRSRPLIEFVHPDDRDKTLAGRQRLAEGAELGPLRNRYLCKNGTYRWFEWRSVAHLDRGLVYAVARDITEQKLAEEQLAESRQREESLQKQLVFADRMASVGTLAAGLAHEINNPLAYVVANSSLILDSLRVLESELPAHRLLELRDMTLSVQEGAERIRKIMRGLKTFSRVEREQRVVLELEPLLELSSSMAYNEIRHRAQLVKDYRPTPAVEADEAQLGQVFINLLINAAQALPEGRPGSNEIRVSTSTGAAGAAVIEVRDTGCGIPAAIRERIFEPFFTTKPVGIGTGQGLAICHNIITGLGGRIEVESTEGAGSVFRVVLPAATRAPAEARPPVRQRPPVVRARVLVLDDEREIGNVLGRILCDHDVALFTSAREALQAIGAGRRFDVIFSDLMMPEMSGMDFHAELVRGFPELASRVVFVSGGAFTPGAASFLEQTANPRIEKPFAPRTVLELVRRFAPPAAAPAF